MRTTVFLTLSRLFTPAVSAAAKGYYRMPAIHGDTIVFTAEGDLWSVSSTGGLAHRLTSHLGEETQPQVSPDGGTLAFSASYEGPTEVYTMPLTGGLPTRRTFETSASVVVGWTPDGRVLYATGEYATLPESQLVSLDLSTGERARIPLTPASDGVYDGDGRTLFFANPDFHRNNTKRYQGGTARNIWRFSAGDAEARNLTEDFPGENHSPMWWNGRVYYICDRDGTMNLWSIDEMGRNPRQHSRHSGWDVLSASLGQGRIVYQVGADVHLYEIRDQKSQRLDIELSSDFDQLRGKWVSNPLDYLTSAHLHPNGKNVALTARGRVFVAPVSDGRLVQISKKPGIRYRDAVFSSGGNDVIALSDESGELEYWSMPADGTAEGRALTRDGTILRWQATPSPDGQWLAYSDQNEDLWILNISSGVQRRISSNREGIGSHQWSPDSRWLVFEETALNTYTQLFLHSIESGTNTTLTSDRTNSRSASFSQDGRFIYFLSDRNLRSIVGSPWGPRQPEPYFDRTMKIYQLSLVSGSRFPFSTKNELFPDTPKAEPSDQPVAVELEGISRRFKEVPVPAGNYSVLAVGKDALFWLSRETGSSAGSDLTALKITNDEAKPVKVVGQVRGFELSQKRNKILIRKGNAIYVIEAGPRAVSDLGDHQVDLSGWTFPIDVREDNRQLYIDAWRLERDYFYDPDMHGVNWEAMRDKYLPLVERVTTRAELSDLIGQLVGEISALHVSVRGGDLRRGDDQIRLASLGARLYRDSQAGGYVVEHIYRSDPDFPGELSPLHDPEVGVREGDLIEAINGTPTLSVDDPHRLLRNQQDRQVLLKVSRPGSESRMLIVKVTVGLSNLRYRDWEYTRRLKVEEMGQGDIGYVHLRAMGAGNLTELVPQLLSGLQPARPGHRCAPQSGR